VTINAVDATARRAAVEEKVSVEAAAEEKKAVTGANAVNVAQRLQAKVRKMPRRELLALHDLLVSVSLRSHLNLLFQAESQR
jgi:hypothetical protein